MPRMVRTMDFAFEQPWGRPGYRGNGLVVAVRRQGYICSDCGDVSSELQTSRPGLKRMPVLTLQDIRDCLGEVRDNEKTMIDVAKAEARDQANAGPGPG